MPRQLQSTDFQACCGATILWGWSNWTYDDLTFKFPRLSRGHVYIAILNASQNANPEAVKGLKDHSFELVSDRTINKNTNNRLYVYVRSLGPKPKPAKKRLFGGNK